jgi:hypothetical protein
MLKSPVVLPDTTVVDGWAKSSYSSPTGDNCLETTVVNGSVAVRSSRDLTAPGLLFTSGEWDAFLAGAKDGEFDKLI